MQNQKWILILLAVICFSYADSTPTTKRLNETAPAIFTARFETTQGDVDIEVTRKWSPKAADRFYALIRSGYYDNAPFYRVIPEFVAQFGSVDTLKMKQWRSVKVPDEEVLQSNRRGTVSFARAGKETREFDLFINLKDNTKLDTINFQEVKGFPVLGVVVKGMETVDKLYSGYEDDPMMSEHFLVNRALLDRDFPKLDVIRKAYILPKK